MAQNCEQHIKVFAWTCGFFVLFMATLTGYVIANENRRVETLSTHEKENTAQFEKISDKISEGFSDIKQRLARIEAQREDKNANNTK